MRLYLKSAALLVVATICWNTAVRAEAAAFSLNPAADAFVSSAAPTSNYGGAGAVTVSAAGLPKGEFQSLLRFDLAPAKASFDSTFGVGGWTLQGLALQLTAAAPLSPLFNASAAGQFSIGWMQNDSWVEGSGNPMAPGATGITYNALPSFLSAGDQSLGTFAFDGATSGNSAYALTLASGIVNDATSGQSASLRFAAADTTVSGAFNSGSFTTVASRPVLTLTAAAVPEPATWLLAALGGSCLVLVGRRTGKTGRSK